MAARISQEGLLVIEIGTPRARLSQLGILVIWPMPLVIFNLPPCLGDDGPGFGWFEA